MSMQASCPISEVDRALSSYIHSRGETLKIRRTISKYLTSSLRPVTAATQNRHLNHECPHNLTAANTYPPGLGGLRLQYLQALRARNQAQTRHRELQTSLQALQERHLEDNPTQLDTDNDNDAVRGYIALLRQRRRVAELQVIQDALDKLLNAKPKHGPMDPRLLVKSTIGEQPDLPAERLEQISQIDEDQTGIFKLKQVVLESKTAMERAQAARQRAQDFYDGSASLEAQVYALERARDELHEWVQGELAKMEEESVFLEDASPVKKSIKDASEIVDVASAEVQIREAYDKYTACRAKLLNAYLNLQQPPQLVPEDDKTTTQDTQSDKQANDSVKPSMPITKVIPHLPHLTQIANEDRVLLRQTVYLQSQIAARDQDIEEALLRISGESHLLPAGSKDVSAWVKTAREAEAATEEAVKKHLQTCKQELGSISAILELSSLQSKVLDTV
ncbi:hypothetical protein ACN47E_002869 [Coniothyrium glycines]